MGFFGQEYNGLYITLDHNRSIPKGSITKYESRNFKKPFYILGYVIEQCIEIW